MRKRNKRFSLWLNEKEFAHLEQQAQNAGVTDALECRLEKRAFHSQTHFRNTIEICPRPPDNITELLRELNHIGNIMSIA
jgi:hypothetical protein